MPSEVIIYKKEILEQLLEKEGLKKDQIKNVTDKGGKYQNVDHACFNITKECSNSSSYSIKFKNNGSEEKPVFQMKIQRKDSEGKTLTEELYDVDAKIPPRLD